MSKKPAIVITGASTGIGAACARYEAERGYRVFAGVRKAADGKALVKDIDGEIIPILIDVTDPKSIQKAAAIVEKEVGQAGLAGLVNNAGIAVPGPLEFVKIEDLRQQFEVNVIGQMAVTQAFLPMLRRATGRIVLMGSIGGRIALPFTGPYNASKHALEAIADALRVELSAWGIHVAIVEPASIRTPIWEKSAPAGIAKQFGAQAHKLYGPILKVMHAFSMQRYEHSLPVESVAELVHHALTAASPRARYPIGRNFGMRVFMNTLPWRLRDSVIRRNLPRWP
jgi:NAD(P)-dependent dehydrogenase (short-subunit alcohol dehydrogenase family)